MSPRCLLTLGLSTCYAASMPPDPGPYDLPSRLDASRPWGLRPAIPRHGPRILSCTGCCVTHGQPRALSTDLMGRSGQVRSRAPRPTHARSASSRHPTGTDRLGKGRLETPNIRGAGHSGRPWRPLTSSSMHCGPVEAGRKRRGHRKSTPPWTGPKKVLLGTQEPLEASPRREWAGHSEGVGGARPGHVQPITEFGQSPGPAQDAAGATALASPRRRSSRPPPTATPAQT